MTLNERSAWSDWLFRGVMVLILVLGFVTMGYVIHLSTQQGKAVATGQDLKIAQDRSDCVRAITQAQTDIVRARDSTGWSGLLAIEEKHDAAIPKLAARLRLQNDAVAKLPTVQSIVNLTCPKVKPDVSPGDAP